MFMDIRTAKALRAEVVEATPAGHKARAKSAHALSLLKSGKERTEAELDRLVRDGSCSTGLLRAAAEDWARGSAELWEAREMVRRHAAGELLSVSEAAERLGVTPRRVRQLLGVLGGIRIGGRWVVPAAAVEARRRG